MFVVVMKTHLESASACTAPCIIQTLLSCFLTVELRYSLLQLVHKPCAVDIMEIRFGTRQGVQGFQSVLGFAELYLATVDHEFPFYLTNGNIETPVDLVKPLRFHVRVSLFASGRPPFFCVRSPPAFYTGRKGNWLCLWSPTGDSHLALL